MKLSYLTPLISILTITTYYIVQGCTNDNKVVSTKPKPRSTTTVISTTATATTITSTANKATALLPYLRANGYNTTMCFVINMKVPSGKKRFFIYNYAQQKIVSSGLVTHGSGRNKQAFGFSNVNGSLCTAKGRYKIGASYQGTFGLAYKLYGLDATNNNAFARFVVLHSHACVPLYNVYPQQICESWGCPTVSPSFLTTLSTIINASAKPIMLVIDFYD